MDDLQAFGIETGRGKYDEEAFYALVLVYTVLFDKVAKYLAKFDLTPAKMNVLMIIKHQGGDKGLSQREIGARLMVTPSNMTRLLDKLEREKLIERTSREGDKRVKVVRISRRGSSILDDAWPGYVQSMKSVMGKLSGDEQKTMSSILLRWLRGLKE